MFRSAGKFSTVLLGTSTGIAAYFYQKLKETENSTIVYNSTADTEKPVYPSCQWNSNWDFRDPKSIVKPVTHNTTLELNRYNAEIEKLKPKATRHIILVRHGEYAKGPTDELQHLTERGRTQAKYVGERLQKLDIKWDKVIASTMTRAQETCQIILKQIAFKPANVKNCDLLREGAPIPPEPAVVNWNPEKSEFFQDGARIEAAFRHYFHRAAPMQDQDSYTLIVGHGNVIRYFLCRALQFPPEAWLRFNINHASITWLSISPTGNVCVKYMGDSGFMPSALLTN